MKMKNIDKQEVIKHVKERLAEVNEYLATAKKYNRKIKVYALEKVQRELIELLTILEK